MKVQRVGEKTLHALTLQCNYYYDGDCYVCLEFSGLLL